MKSADELSSFEETGRTMSKVLCIQMEGAGGIKTQGSPVKKKGNFKKTTALKPTYSKNRRRL